MPGPGASLKDTAARAHASPLDGDVFTLLPYEASGEVAFWLLISQRPMGPF